jgi:hypothetical protein
MGERDGRQFLVDILTSPENSINKMLATIQAERSLCFGEDDREHIVLVIQETVGFEDCELFFHLQ